MKNVVFMQFGKNRQAQANKVSGRASQQLNLRGRDTSVYSTRPVRDWTLLATGWLRDINPRVNLAFPGIPEECAAEWLVTYPLVAVANSIAEYFNCQTTMSIVKTDTDGSLEIKHHSTSEIADQTFAGFLSAWRADPETVGLQVLEREYPNLEFLRFDDKDHAKNILYLSKLTEGVEIIERFGGTQITSKNAIPHIRYMLANLRQGTATRKEIREFEVRFGDVENFLATGEEEPDEIFVEPIVDIDDFTVEFDEDQPFTPKEKRELH